MKEHFINTASTTEGTDGQKLKTIKMDCDIWVVQSPGTKLPGQTAFRVDLVGGKAASSRQIWPNMFKMSDSFPVPTTKDWGEMMSWRRLRGELGRDWHCDYFGLIEKCSKRDSLKLFNKKRLKKTWQLFLSRANVSQKRIESRLCI